MGQAKIRGTKDQRVSQALDKLACELDGFPEMLFGYDRPRREDESAFEISEDGLVCMVSSISLENRESLCKSTGVDFKIGQWFASHGAHENTVVYGPFENSGEAMDFSMNNFGAVRFMSPPSFG